MAMNFICSNSDGWYTVIPYEKNSDSTRTYFPFNATLITWCKETFGIGESDQRWRVTEYTFWFHYEQDRILFILKWL